ncbi:hypothetical protein EIL87_05300 [Saccharopolyspora rhizosphaerae]|uniref:Uncharacterized protein n=1 Tax=Saccharopolyspora rhizosphaerae TaxID=2492662 RepID=A0A426K0T0_9PSEU|nr:DUF6541 family protein [Saccharopolyspora rhizosphaerae]RRO18923.1 hypothetical protein EIL87_05300 [Saccharopolyspora rhizosphaerae]
MIGVWAHASPVWVAALVWLLLAGLPVAAAVRLRGCAAWAMAPALAVTTLALAALAAEPLQVRWTPTAALCAVAFATALAMAVNGLFLRPPRHDRGVVRACAAGGALVGGVLGGIVLVRALRSPDALSQSFDAVFHYTALAAIRDTGEASSLSLRALDVPGVSPRWYPAAWHDVTALVLASGGDGSIPAAANAVSGLIAVLVWPLACIFLARQVFGPRPAVLIVTGLYSVGFAAFPWGLLQWGVLWPNLLGLSLVPTALGLVLTVLGQAVDDVVGRPRALVLLVVVLVGMGLAHPNAVVSFLVMALVVALLVSVRRFRATADARLPGFRWSVAGAVGLPVLLLAALRLTPVMHEVAATWWPPESTSAAAVGEVLLHATHGRRAEWLLAAVTVVGLVRSLRDPALRWIPAVHAVSAALFVMAASVQSPWTMVVTGFWYSDSWRLAAMLPITGVPLAALGTVAIADWVGRRSGVRIAVPAGAMTLLIALVIAGATKGMHQGRNALAVHSTFAVENVPGTNLVSPEELEFFEQVRDRVEPGAVVANNPWDGSALLWPLQGRRVLFGQLDGRTRTPEQDYLARNLVRAASDPHVCRIAKKLNVRYLIVGEKNFWPTDSRVHDYPGVREPTDNSGFRLVHRHGELALFALAACFDQLEPVTSAVEPDRGGGTW